MEHYVRIWENNVDLITDDFEKGNRKEAKVIVFGVLGISLCKMSFLEVIKRRCHGSAMTSCHGCNREQGNKDEAIKNYFMRNLHG